MKTTLRLTVAACGSAILCISIATAQAQFSYTTNGGAITVAEYTGSAAEVTIPGTIGDLPVTRIGDFAFHACTNLINVTIPGSVTNIGNGAFYNCTILTRLDFQGNAPRAGVAVFENAFFVTAYYLSGTTGWGAMFGGRRTMVVAPLPLVGAEPGRFFRIVGPAAATITAFSPDGYITWTCAVTDVTYTIQTAVTLVGPSNWVDYIQMPLSNNVITHRLYDPNPPADMVLIPAGSFTMGNCLDQWPMEQEIPLHTVYVSAFYLERYEVTKALWDEVYQWATNRSYTFDNPGMGKAPNHPVLFMSWHDAVKWCNARSEKEGLVPAYHTDAGQMEVYRSGTSDLDNTFVNWDANGYRLPTEAEWEKAARGGASGHRYPWIDTDDIDHSRANYWGHPTFETGDRPYTSPIGYFAGTGYGLYDIIGNAREWCWDRYSGSYYSESPASDPRGPSTGDFRSQRGGNWNDGPFTCSSRTGDTMLLGHEHFGLRCARGL
jgi:formylglycine-generating enzyme required for sulfatase activity